MPKQKLEPWVVYQEYINGLSVEKIALKYNIVPGTVNKHIARAKQQV